MKALILPVVLALVGTGAGVGAGLFLAPSKEEPMETEETEMAETEEPKEEMDDQALTAGPEATEASSNMAYARLNNQFVVPVVSDGAVSALVVMSLSVEVPSGSEQIVYMHEPKLRDAFLQAMFDHANIGGFDGAFTSSENMSLLRGALRRQARLTLGDIVTDVLIIDIVRQDN